MTNPTGDTRDLQYPLDRSLVSQADTPNDTIANYPFSWPTLDSDERVNITLNVSLNEFTALSSAIDVGSDIAYGDNAILIWWLWVRSANSMEFCQQIIDCIENDPAVGGAITQYLIDTGSTDPNTIDYDSTSIDDRFPNTQRENEISEPVENCDLDMLWGGCKEIALRLDDNARTILENAIVINDTYERYANVVAAIPIIGDVVADIANTFTEIIPDIYNSYNAWSSTEHIEELACSFFDIACAECRYPTFNEIANTIAEDSFGALLNWESMSLATVIGQFVQTGQFTPTLVWHSMLLFELFTVYLGATWNGITGTKALTQWALLGEDEPSNDWELLCDACEPPTEWTWSYSANQCDYGLPSGWVLNITEGLCENSVGSFDGIVQYSGGALAQVTFTITPPVGKTITVLSFQAASNTTGGSRSMQIDMQTSIYNGVLNQNWNTYNFTPNEQGVITWNLMQSGTGFNGVGVRQIHIEWTN